MVGGLASVGLCWRGGGQRWVACPIPTPSMKPNLKLGSSWAAAAQLGDAYSQAGPAPCCDSCGRRQPAAARQAQDHSCMRACLFTCLGGRVCKVVPVQVWCCDANDDAAEGELGVRVCKVVPVQVWCCDADDDAAEEERGERNSKGVLVQVWCCDADDEAAEEERGERVRKGVLVQVWCCGADDEAAEEEQGERGSCRRQWSWE